MHVIRSGNRYPGRRLKTPEWALNNELMREALVAYLENRVLLKSRGGSLKARLARCKKACSKKAKVWQEHVEKRIREYRAVRNKTFVEVSEKTYARVFCAALRGELETKFLRDAEMQIRAADSDLLTTKRAAELAASVSYMYYRLGWDSPTVGHAVGLNAPHVRQILFRMNRAYARKFGAF